MRIAIIHDDFSVCGGGEKLVALLAENLIKKGFKTDIYSYDISEQTKKIIPKGFKIKTIARKMSLFKSEGFKIKTIARKMSLFKSEGFKRFSFSQLDLRKQYDFFIFSGYLSISAAKKHKPNIFYCHNTQKPNTQKPVTEKLILKPRTLDLINNSFIEKTWKTLFNIKNKLTKKPISEKISGKIDALRLLIANSFSKYSREYLKYAFTYLNFKNINEYNQKIKELDSENIEQIDKIIVNSKNIKDRIKKIYKKDSRVIYPPIETSKLKYKKHKNYWLSVNRVVPAKRIEMQIKAFSKLPKEKLCIIGNIEDQKYYEKLNKIKLENTEFIGVLNNQELIKKISECKGLLFTVKDEDFGMAPVEAMASGKPVIAANEGGCKETIINGKTGILINNIDKNKIVRAIKKLGKEISKNPKKYKNACQRQAKKFDVNIFVEKMKKEIKEQIEKKQTIKKEIPLL